MLDMTSAWCTCCYSSETCSEDINKCVVVLITSSVGSITLKKYFNYICKTND